MDIDASNCDLRNDGPSLESFRLTKTVFDAKLRHRTSSARRKSRPNFQRRFLVPKNAFSLWNILVIILTCALFANASRYPSRLHESQNMFKIDEEGADDSSTVRREDDDFNRRNMRMFAVVGHHFNRSLAEEVKAFDSKVISDGDILKVHFPRHNLPGSEWLVYHRDGLLLQGVPLPTHEGPFNFYVTVMHVNTPSQSALTLPCTVEVLTEEDAVEKQRELSGFPQLAIDAPLTCSHRDPVTTAIMILKAESKDFSHLDRLDCVRNLENLFDIPTRDVTFHPSSDSMRRDGPILSGPGNVPKIRNHRGDRDTTSSVALSWPLGCSTDVIGDVPKLDRLETSAMDGSLARAIGYDVSEWQIVNRLHHSRRTKRNVDTDSPKATKLSPSRNNDVKSMEVPQTEVTVATIRTGRTRVAINAIRATPAPILPARATKLPTSPMDRRDHNSLLSTPVVRPPMSMPPTDFTFDDNEPPMMLMSMDHVDALYGTYVEFRIPNDVFYDTQDGTTWNLNLELIDSKTNEDIPDGKSWVRFDADAQLLFGVPDETALKEREFVLFARDSGGKSASITFMIRVDMSEPPPPASHNFTFYFSDWPDIESDNDLYTAFGRKLTAGLAKTENMPGQFVMLKNGLVPSSNYRFVTWFDRSLNREDLCQSKALREEAGLMIGGDAKAGRNRPAREFVNKFKSEFILTEIRIDLLGPCYKHTTTSTTTTATTTTSTSPDTTLTLTTLALTPPIPLATPKQIAASVSMTPDAPQVGKPLPVLVAREGRMVQFTLPRASFVDSSGAESDLKINFTDPPPSWIALDSETRTLCLMPTLQDRDSFVSYNSTYNSWTGGVVAKNANGAMSKPLAVKVLIQLEKDDEKEKANHKFSITITNYEIMNFTAFHKARLIRLISSVFGDDGGSNLYFYPVRKGSVIFSWHNSSLAYVDPCPYRQIGVLASTVFNGNNFKSEAKEKFRDAGFTIKRIELHRPSWCTADVKVAAPDATGDPETDVAIAGRQGKTTTIIIIAVVVVCLVVLIVILVVKCRMGQTSKDRKDDRTEKLVREEAAVAAGNTDPAETPRIKKGVPIILQGEEIALEPNGSAHASPASPLVTYRDNGGPVGHSTASDDENIHAETPFTSPSSHHHLMTPPTPIMSDRPPPPYVKSR